MKYILILTIAIFTYFATTIFAATNNNSIRTTPLSGTVALTFDDGPSPIYTPQILKILKDNNIRATFFVMGALAKKYPNLIKQIHSDGHSIQLHSMTHAKLTRLSEKGLRYEILQTQKNIANILGYNPKCLRPPYGLKNKNVVQFANRHGIIVVPIGFNSFDYDNRGVTKLTNWVVNNAKSKTVVLLHDGYKYRQQTVDALPKIIKGIRNKGLGFSAICVPR